MRIAIGSDQRGSTLRTKVIKLLEQLGHEVEDVGPYANEAVDYPDIASLVARNVSNGRADRGILVGKIGLGMSIVANKFHGVRAAPCHDDLTAEMSRRRNDTNILCLSVDLQGEDLIERTIRIWLSSPFVGGRHAQRVAKIVSLEREIATDLEKQNRQ